jgi:hypothetical protein
MSDFLTNLAARALASPSLRPRTRSRFEPAADANPRLDAGEPVDLEVPSLPASTQRHAIAAAPLIEKADVVADPDRRASRRSPRPSRDLDESEPEPRRSRDRIEQEVLLTTATREHHLERVIEKRETTVRVHAENTVRTAAESPRDTEPSHRHDEQPPRIEPQRHTPRAAFAIAERRPSTRQPRTETPPAAPEPVIHVSIGRVEVRAVAPAPAPQRARARTAPMTIEEYAARKAKGRP